MQVETKKCTSCGLIKPIIDFRKREQGNSEKRNSYCNDCFNRHYNEWQNNHRQEMINFFGSQCYLCGKLCKDKYGRGFHFHEIHGKRHYVTIWYAKKHKEDFRLLCSRCHTYVTGPINLLHFSWERIIHEYKKLHPEWKSLFTEKEWENPATKQIQELLNELPVLENRDGKPWVNPEKAAILVKKLKDVLEGK